MHLKVLSAKCLPFFLSPIVLTSTPTKKYEFGLQHNIFLLTDDISKQISPTCSYIVFILLAYLDKHHPYHKIPTPNTNALQDQFNVNSLSQYIALLIWDPFLQTWINFNPDMEK